MSDFMISRIQVRRGLRKDLPEIIHSGEICFCTDTFEVFIGTDSGIPVNLNEILLGATGPQGEKGETGPMGPAGKSISMLSYADKATDLPFPGEENEIAIAEGCFYSWNNETQEWENKGSIMGPKGPTGNTGPTGPQGDQGVCLRVRDYIKDESLLPDVGEPGDVYIVNNIFYAWD